MVEKRRLMRAATALAICVFILFALSKGVKSGSITTGYSTAYQGAKAQFIGVVYNGNVYDAQHISSDASVAQFDTTMNFDPDGATVGHPNVVGEMTPVYIPSAQNIPPDSLAGIPLSSAWWRDALGWSNPVRTFTWNLNSTDGTKHIYKMEEWQTKWFVTLSADWDSGPDTTDINSVGPQETANHMFHDLYVWFKFDVNDGAWYFNGTDKTYFAISKLELSDFSPVGHDASGKLQTGRDSMSVVPSSPGSIVYLYYVPYSSQQVSTVADIEHYAVSGADLNPSYFRSTVYACVDLKNFGVSEGGYPWNKWASGDAVTFGFNVMQFVVGEWKVQPTSNVNPADYGRSSKTATVGILPDLSQWLNQTFANGYFQEVLFMALIVLVVIIVASGPMMPWILNKIFFHGKGDD